MRKRRYNMTHASGKRWIVAQRAEKKYSHILEHTELPTESQFFSKTLPISSEFFNGKSILEVGCGPAAEIHYLKEAHFRVGIDPLAFEWRHLYRNGTKHIQGMGEYLPFKDETFDIVLCLNVLDHVQSPIFTLKEIKRVLKEEGVLVLWLQTYTTSKIIRKRLLNLIDRPHPHHFIDGEVSFMLQKIGYSINYHQCMRGSLKAAISVIQSGLITSGLKSLSARLFTGLCESSFMCSKVIWEEKGMEGEKISYKEE